MTIQTRIIARRGDAEIAPENTLPAFISAIERGADGIELDVHPTADGHLIVHHFYNLGNTDNGEGLVHEKTLSELQALDSGSWFSPQLNGAKKPTLNEVMVLCKGRIRLEIDLKGSNPDFLRQVLMLVEDFDMIGEVELTTSHYPLLPLIKNTNPQFTTGSFFLEPPTWMPVWLAQQQALDWAILLKIDRIHLHITLITREFVQQLIRLGFSVHGSNLDTQEEMQRGIALGINSFSTGNLTLALQLRKVASNSTRQKAQ